MEQQTIDLNTDTLSGDVRSAIRAKCGEVKRHKAGHIEAKISIAGDDEQRHDLFDATGFPLLVVVTDHDRYIGEQAPEPIDPDQPGLLDAAD